MIRKLTIGILTASDFDGAYFTIQSLRLHHPEAMGEVEFLVLDNQPDSPHGKSVSDLTKWVKEPIRYVPITDTYGTALRDRIFSMAETPYVMSLDSHVLLAPEALRKLIDFMETDEGSLLQGPMLYDDLRGIATHFDPIWRDHMWGIWQSDERGMGVEPFEIPAQGLGVFACRRESWPGFNPHFRGFGGEECYIHEKFRQRGRKTLCLPFLKWVHRFGRPNGVPYKLCIEDRIRNYFIGHVELGLDIAPVMEHFIPILGQTELNLILIEVHNLLGK